MGLLFEDVELYLWRNGFTPQKKRLNPLPDDAFLLIKSHWILDATTNRNIVVYGLIFLMSASANALVDKVVAPSISRAKS